MRGGRLNAWYTMVYTFLMPFHIACVSLWPGNCPFGHVSQREDEKTYEEGTTDIISLKHILLSWLYDFSTSHQYRTICILPPSAFLWTMCYFLLIDFGTNCTNDACSQMVREWSFFSKKVLSQLAKDSDTRPLSLDCLRPALQIPNIRPNSMQCRW